MSDNFSLLRSKQSEDVSAMSIVQNKNSSTIEFALSNILERLSTLEESISNFDVAILESTMKLEFDFDIIATAQQIDVGNANMSIVVSSTVASGVTTFQIYVVRLDATEFIFSEKLYQILYNETVVKPVFIRLTPNSATLNFTFKTVDLISSEKPSLLIFS